MPRCFSVFLLFLVFILLKNQVAAHDPSPRGDLRIMWYNVENMFHPSDDSAAGDDEFTPAGLRHWTWERYHRKICQIAKVIVAAGEWDPPDLVGLCEIENLRVLEDLVSHPVLEPYDYKIIHHDSPDHRGMDVACLYREKRIAVSGWSACPPDPSGSLATTRSLLHLCMSWREGDTLDLFLLHFISKYGGVGATADYRKMQAGELVKRIDSVQQYRGKYLVVVAGDFNEDFNGYSLEPVRCAFSHRDTIFCIPHSGMEGSYKYRGRWSRIDQFLVTGRADHLTMKATVMDLAALLAPDELYQGTKPFRTYEGFSYRGGISDHLPLLLDITQNSSPSHFVR